MRRLLLQGNVQVWQNRADGDKYELSSDELVVKPEQQFAQTDKPVKISNKYGRTQAVGMKANLKTERVELLSNVRGIHEIE